MFYRSEQVKDQDNNFYLIRLIIILLHWVECKERAIGVQILCGIVEQVILYCKKTCLTGQLPVPRFSICFGFPTFKKCPWNKAVIINNMLDILVCIIAVYFYSLFVFWLALQARRNTELLVKILSDTTHQNVW